MNEFLKKHGHFVILGLAAACSMALVFSINGFFDTRIDAPIYAAQITSFSEGTVFSGDATVLMRLFKPLYGFIGGWVFHSAHPYGMILSLNIFFYLGLIAAAYFLFKELSFPKYESTVGALWIATAYPVLKYGLALGTDVSGWFFSALTLLVGMIALRKDSNFLLATASVIGFIGAISKESGALGLVALGLVALWRFRKRGIRIFLSRMCSLVLPAAILYAALIGLIAGHAPTLLDWLHSNNAEYATAHTHSLFKFLAVEASAFGLYWAGVMYGLFLIFKGRQAMKHLDVITSTFIATLPILAWPLFISRISFIQFLWVMPLAVFAFAHARRVMTMNPSRHRKLVIGCIIMVPIAFNVALFLLGSGGSLFDRVHL